MIELKVHRFTDCSSFPQDATARVQRALTTMDLRRVTCDCCKQRIITHIASQHWSRLVDSEVMVLEIAALETDLEGSVPAQKSSL